MLSAPICEICAICVLLFDQLDEAIDWYAKDSSSVRKRAPGSE
jgi:hypothetical protein